jgi:hypothetical protein
MMDEGALLVGRIERWAWALTAALSLGGFLAGGLAVGGGVAAGGAVGILNFRWLHFFLRIVLVADLRWTKVLTHLGMAVRYLALTVVLLLLIKSGWVNLVAVLVGLSVVTVAVLGAGLMHGLQTSEPANQIG